MALGTVIALARKNPNKAKQSRFNNHDTIKKLEELLVEARAGRLEGIAFAGLHKTHRYVYGYSAETSTNPALIKVLLRKVADSLLYL